MADYLDELFGDEVTQEVTPAPASTPARPAPTPVSPPSGDYLDELFAGEDRPAPVAPKAKPGEDPTWTDYARALGTWTGNRLQNIEGASRWLNQDVFGGPSSFKEGSIADKLGDIGEQGNKELMSKMTPAGRRNLESTLWSSEDFWSSLGLKLTASAPDTVVSAGVGGAAVKGLLAGGAEATSAATAGLIGATGDAAIQNVGSSFNDISDVVMKMKLDDLKSSSPEFAANLKAGMSEQEARQALLNDLGRVGPALSGAITAVTAKLGIEGAIAQSAAGKLFGKGLVSGFVKGFLGEGGQEALENGIQEIVKQDADQKAKGNRELSDQDIDWTSVFGQMGEGFVVGGVMGGVPGAVLPHDTHEEAKDEEGEGNEGSQIDPTAGQNAGEPTPGGTGTPSPPPAKSPLEEGTKTSATPATPSTLPAGGSRPDAPATTVQAAAPAVSPELKAAIDGSLDEDGEELGDVEDADLDDGSAEFADILAEPDAATPAVDPDIAAAMPSSPVINEPTGTPEAVARRTRKPRAPKTADDIVAQVQEAVAAMPPPPQVEAPAATQTAAPVAPQQAPVQPEAPSVPAVAEEAMPEPAGPMVAPPEPVAPVADPFGMDQEMEPDDDVLTPDNVTLEEPSTIPPAAQAAIQRGGGVLGLISTEGLSQPKEEKRPPLKLKRRKEVVFDGRPAPETLAEPAPEGRKPRTEAVKAVMRPELMAQIEQETDLPTGERAAVVDSVFNEFRDEIDSGQIPAVADIVRRMGDTIRQRASAAAKEHQDTLATTQQAEEIASTVEGVRRARAIAEGRLTEGTNQEKERAGKLKGKTATGIESETERTFLRRAQKEVDARGENAPEWAREAVRLFNERKLFRGKQGGVNRKNQKAKTDAIEALRVQLAESERTKGNERKPIDVTPEEKAEIERNVKRTPEEREAAAEEAARGKNKERDAEHAAIAKKAVDQVANVTGDPPRTGGRPLTLWMKSKVSLLTKALNDAGISTPSKVDRSNSPAQNFLAYVRGLMKSPDPNDTADAFHAALVLENDPQNMYDLVKSDASEANFVDRIDMLGEDAASRSVFDDPNMQAQAEITGFTTPQPVDFTGTTLRNRRMDDKNGAEVQIDPENVKRLGDEPALAEDFAEAHSRGWNFMGGRKGGIGALQDAMNKRVAQTIRALLKDVPIIEVSPDDMQQLQSDARTLQGFWSEPTAAARAAGAKGFMVIRDDLDPAERAAVIQHEAVHGLSHFAVEENLFGMRDVIVGMLKALKARHPTGFIRGTAQYHYGFENAHEFITEAFSNPAFQQFLGSQMMPTDVYQKVVASERSRGAAMSFWDGFLGIVQKVLGLANFGPVLGRSYLDGIVRISEPVLRDDDFIRTAAAQLLNTDPRRAMALRTGMLIGRKGRTGSYLHDPGPEDLYSAGLDSYSVSYNTEDALNTVKEAARQPGATAQLRRWANALKNLPQLSEDIGRILGEDNPARRLTDWARRHQPAARKRMTDGDNLVLALMNLSKSDKVAADNTSAFLHDATVAEVDPTVALTHANNKHISKKGLLDEHKRATHARLAAKFAQLSPAAQKVARDIQAFYRDKQNEYATKMVETFVEEAANKGVLDLPPGATRQQLKDWILSGGIDRVGSQARETSEDKAFAASLGPGMLKLMKEATSLRLVKGTYVPLMRRGDYVVQAKRLFGTPAGAVAKGNQFIFKDKKAFTAFLKANSDVFARKPQSYWYDPKTGKKSTKQDGGKQAFIVSMQDRYLEAFESLKEAQDAAAELKKDPRYGEVSDAQMRQDLFNTQQSLMPQTAQGILDKALANISDESIKKVAKGAMTRAILETTAGTRIQRRRLKRNAVAGYSQDLAANLRDYNVSMSNHLTTLEVRPIMNEAMKDLDKEIKQRAYAGDGSGLRLQELVRELRLNMEANDKFDPSASGSRLVNVLLTASFLKYLASPAHSIINGLQPWMVTVPYLAGQHGEVTALRSIRKAYADIGGGRVALDGFRNIGRAGQRVIGRAIEDMPGAAPILDRVAKLKDGAELQAVLQHGIDLGMLDHDAGMEMDPSELGKSKIEVGLGRVAGVMRAMPTAIESINRSTTIIAAYRLARAAGKDVDAATRYAMNAVTNTQGDYSTVAAPRFMKTATGRLIFQFKKYPQMMMRLLTKSVYDSFKGASPAERKAARKQFAYIALHHALIAGATGLPFLEIAKILVMASAAMGLSEDDWEDWEQGIQGYLNQILGETMSEITMQGLPRAIGVDLSSRVGLDSLMLFGAPKTLDNQAIKAWAFDTAVGAPVGLGFNMMEAMANGKWGQVLPIQPKVIGDTFKAIAGVSEGTKSRSGRQLVDPYSVWDGLVQATGFQPAKKAHAYEAGGSAYAITSAEKEKAKRTQRMQGYLNAETGEERAAAWRRIRADNVGRPRAQQITMEQLRKAMANRQRRDRKDAATRRSTE